VSRLKRPCLGGINPATNRKEGCGIPTNGSRCPKHAAWAKPSPSVRGYDKQYRREREELLAGAPLCQLRLPGCTIYADTADHVTPLAAGGSRRGPLQPACKHCNSKKQASLI